MAWCFLPKQINKLCALAVESHAGESKMQKAFFNEWLPPPSCALANHAFKK